MKHIVFIPGIMGSELYEGRPFFGGTKRWFNVMNRSVKRLAIKPGEEDKIYPGGPMSHGYKLMGSIIKENVIYATLMDELSTLDSGTFKFHPYGYDWRKDLWETCKDLHILLKKFSNEEIYIVAHSMGGLLAHTYCQWAQTENKLPNIKQVITIGTPWKGSPDSFMALKYGLRDRGYFFPETDTTMKISRTFPTTYQLLPSINYCLNEPYLEYNGRLLRWAECIEYVENLEGCNIKSARMLNQDLHDSLAKSWPSSIEHFNIIGCNHGSVGSLKINDNGQDEMYQPVDGDGVVPLTAAIPYNNVNSTILYAQASHQGLVKYKPVINLVMSIIEKGTPDTVEGIFDSYKPREDWTMERIDCPVDVIIDGEEEEDINKATEDITKHSIGEATYLIHNNPTPKKIKVEAYEDGRTTIETIKIVDGKVKSKTKFPSVDADPTRKAIIDVSFDGNKPITRVYMPSEDNPEHSIEITGLTVEVPINPNLTAPKTRIMLTPVGKSSNSNYDEKGVKLDFEFTEGNSQILETLYRVNEGTWRSFREEVILNLGDCLIPGKNKIEYYSKDVYDNVEKPKSRIIYINPDIPKTLFNINLKPDQDCYLTLQSLYEGVGNYKFIYKYGPEGMEIIYNKPISFKIFDENEIYVKAIDVFGRESNWEKVVISFAVFADTVWNIDGFEGTIDNIISYLPNPEEDFISCIIGRNEKDIIEKIPKTAKSLILKFKKINYTIELMPKLELYLHYHSQIISRDEKNIKISFSIYDANENPIKDLQPSVKYTLLPAQNTVLEAYIPPVSNNGKGIYTFNVPVEKLPKFIQKIKVEFRDVPSRIKPLDTRIFKVE